MGYTTTVVSGITATSRERLRIKLVMLVFSIFHNGEVLFLRIWADYEDQKDDLFALYSSTEDFYFTLFGSKIAQCVIKGRPDVKKKELHCL